MTYSMGGGTRGGRRRQPAAGGCRGPAGWLGLGCMRSDGIDRSQAFGWEEIEPATGIEASIGGHVGWNVCLMRGLVLGVQASAGRHAANLHSEFATGASCDERLRETIIDGRFLIGYRF